MADPTKEAVRRATNIGPGPLSTLFNQTHPLPGAHIGPAPPEVMGAPPPLPPFMPGPSLGAVIPTRDFRGIEAEDYPPSLKDSPLLSNLEPSLRSLGKKISDLLGTVFTTEKGSGLPRRLTLTQWNADKGTMQLHAPSGEVLESSPTQLDKLINAGKVDLEQPPTAGTSLMRRRLDAMLPEYKDEQFSKAKK